MSELGATTILDEPEQIDVERPIFHDEEPSIHIEPPFTQVEEPHDMQQQDPSSSKPNQEDTVRSVNVPADTDKKIGTAGAKKKGKGKSTKMAKYIAKAASKKKVPSHLGQLKYNSIEEHVAEHVKSEGSHSETDRTQPANTNNKPTYNSPPVGNLCAQNNNSEPKQNLSHSFSSTLSPDAPIFSPPVPSNNHSSSFVSDVRQRVGLESFSPSRRNSALDVSLKEAAMLESSNSQVTTPSVNEVEGFFGKRKRAPIDNNREPTMTFDATDTVSGLDDIACR